MDFLYLTREILMLKCTCGVKKLCHRFLKKFLHSFTCVRLINNIIHPYFNNAVDATSYFYCLSVSSLFFIAPTFPVLILIQHSRRFRQNERKILKNLRFWMMMKNMHNWVYCTVIHSQLDFIFHPLYSSSFIIVMWIKYSECSFEGSIFKLNPIIILKVH